MRRAHRLILTVVCVMLLTQPAATPQGIGTVVGLVGGVFAVDQTLEKLNEKVRALLQESGYVGSLLSSKVARDIELLIGKTRSELNDELNVQTDHLDAHATSLINQVAQQIGSLQESISTGGKIEDRIYLDVESLLLRVPFTNNIPSIRRVDGATQYFQGPSALYRIVVTGNIFDDLQGDMSAGLRDFKVTLNEKEITQYVHPMSPHSISLELPGNVITSQMFSDAVMKYYPIKIFKRVNNRDFKAQLWKSPDRLAYFTFDLELFPKNIAAYRLVEYRGESQPDATVTSLQKGSAHLVPGCGNRGCNAWQEFCESLPVGAQPVSVTNYTDNLNGWFGNWEPQKTRPTADGFCS